ncbi:MAG: PAS domain S-box protein [Bacteroidota bacterium]|nr:PAS domain S-box protein [Bacteroidota bacterium]
MKKDTDKTKEQLAIELEKLRKQSKKREKELKAAIETLDANNQQLRATEQQLRAANQQLDASNKQTRASETRMRNLFNAMQDLVFEMDYNGTYLNIAPTSSQLLVKPAEEVTGKTLHDVFPKQQADPFLQFIQKCIDENKADKIIYPIKFDNKTIWFEGRANPIGNKRVLYIASDITERKHAKEKLEEREEKYRTIFESAKDAIFIMQEDKFIDCNEKTLEMFGCDREDIIGEPPYEFSPEKQPNGRDSREKAIEKINKAIEGEPQLFEWVHTTKDGDLFHTEVTLSRYMINDERFVLAIVRDTTKHKQAEEALRESEMKFRNLSESTITGIMLYQNDYWIYANPAAEEVTGYTFGELKQMKFWEFTAPEYVDLIKERGKARQKGKHAPSEYEFKIITKQGKEKWVFLTGNTTELKSGKAGLITAIDITERKQAEIELTLAKAKAEESERLKSAFLANMSHEIRTPMNGILGFTELLKEPQLTGDEKDEYIRIIEKNGTRMLNTINDIVDISKIEAGHVEVRNTELSVNKLLDEQYNFFVRETTEKGLELNYSPSLPDNESRIITDQYKLEGILTNLIKNAIKYTETGSITFGYSTKSLKGKDVFEFYVKDTGIGIPAERIDAIFNRFEQADIEDTKVYEGSGLGLAITKSYVEMLGGEIVVNSKEGSGSTFTFNIPYNKKSSKENSSKKNSEEESGVSLKNLSVIVAEDDETSRMFFETILENHVKRITYTITGKETIEKCRENPDTDIILMDIKMHDINGYDATREIRKINKDVTIIAQTAHALEGDKDKALEAGCDDYIAKPIEKEILFEKIRACLNKKSI